MNYPALFKLKESELQHIEYATYIDEDMTLIKCSKVTAIFKLDEDTNFACVLKNASFNILEISEFSLSSSGQLEILCKKEGIE